MKCDDSFFGTESGRMDRLVARALEDSETAESVSPMTPLDRVLEQPGSQIDRYQLLRVLGEGGMGVVYLAEQTEPIQRQVALKVIKLGMDTRQVIVRFEAERQALALMDHPNIARVLDAGATETGRPYFVMELVTGVSITEYCDQNHLSTKDRLALFLQVCHAVQHAHQKGIIHRDLKPSNVLVTLVDGAPVPKIIDFGIAKATEQRLTEKTLFTRDGHVIGTPVYMSPEQAELSELDVDTRSDIYSLGVVLYELLTGTTPFSERELRQAGYLEMQRVIREQVPVKPSTRLSTLGETLTEVAQRRRSTPDLLRKALRGDLDWIVMKSLEKDRVRRYETVSGLAEDVRRHLEHEPILARGPTRTYRLAKFLRRHRSQVAALLVLAVIAAAAGGVLALWNRDRLRLLETEAFRDQSLLSQARGQYAKGDRPAALKMVQSLLPSRYVGPDAQFLYATLLVERRLPDEATALLKQLVNDRPAIAGAAHALWARLLWEGGSLEAAQPQEVEEHRRQAADLLPDTPEAHFLQAMGEVTIPGQLAALDRALELDPSHYESHRLRAFIYYASRKYEKMERDAYAMMVLAPTDPQGYFLQALAWHQLGHYPEALANYDRARARTLPEDPLFIELLSRRGEVLMRMGQYEPVLAAAREGLKQTPNATLLSAQVFCALTALGRYEEARALMQDIIEAPDCGATDDQVRLWSMNYVFDVLAAGGRWHPPDSQPEGPAFFYMFEAEETYRGLCAKARRLIPDSFSSCWSPDGTKVVFALGLLGYSGVAVYDVSSRETNLLIVPGKDPSWSPDGRHIAFVRDVQALHLSELTTDRIEARARTPAYITGEEVWVIKADGSAPRRLASHAHAPSWSADAQRVYYRSHSDSLLYSMALEDSRTPPVPVCACSWNPPAPSPAGNYVANVDGGGRLGVLQIVDVATQSCYAEWATPLELSGAFWSPDGRELSFAGVYRIRARAGLWIYDLTKREAVKVLPGPVGGASWSPDRTHLLIRLSSPYWETWVADLDPRLSTAEALKPVQTLEEHCREAIAICTRDLEADPGSYVDRWIRAASAVWINHPQAPAYLQDWERALDERGFVPWDAMMQALRILGDPGLCTRLEPLAFALARKVVENQGGYSIELLPGFDRLGQNEHADQLRRLAQEKLPPGSCRYEKRSATYLVVGCGGDIWGTIDDFHFAYKQLQGDGSITAKVESVEDIHKPSKAGIMIRASLDPRAPFAAVYVTPNSGVTFQTRTDTTGGTGSDSDNRKATPEQNALRAPVWLRIERKGDQFSAFYSSDGVAWTLMAWSPQSISVPASVYLGLAVTSHDNKRTVEARISHVATTGNVSPSGPFAESRDVRFQLLTLPAPAHPDNK
jgi:serine/threonine protein kinase/Tol biopolymer transport system component/tetratricopeptide (TPR) repeat protein